MRMLQAISNKITTMFKREESGITGKGQTDSTLMPWMSQFMRISYERKQTHLDMHRMDKDHPVTKFALDTYASRSLGLEDTTLDSFTVDVQAEEQEDGSKISESEVKVAQWQVKQVIKRLNLQNDAWQIIRRFVKFGDEIREILIDPTTLDIVGIKHLPEHTVIPNTDDLGNRIPGFTQILDGGKTVTFSEWEILQFSFGEIDGYKGTPLFDCARKNFKRLSLAEDSTALARLIRAFVKLVHKVPVSPSWSSDQKQSAIDGYKEKMTKMKIFSQDPNDYGNADWPQSVATDLFITSDGTDRGGIEMLDPENAQLQNINDLLFFMDIQIMASHMPKRYFPFEGSTPKLSEGGGNTEDKNFACMLVMCQNIFKHGISQLLDRQLAMKGIDPNTVRYIFRMADINTVDQLRIAQTGLADAKTLDLLIKSFPGMTEKVEVILREFTRMNDASISELKDMKMVEPSETGNTPEIDNRVQLPGTGVGPEVRSKV